MNPTQPTISTTPEAAGVAEIPVETPPATAPPAETPPAATEAPVPTAPVPVEPIEQSEPIDETPAGPPPKITSPIFVSKRSTFAEILATLGFASIFLVNATVAYVHPNDFTKMLTDNIVASKIGHVDTLVHIAMFNDLFIGVLILWNRWRTTVFAWAGGWLLMVAGLQLMNLFF